MIRKLIAETVGTGVLVFFGVGAATLSFGFHLTGASVSAGVVATALVFGLVLFGLMYALGTVSGCHLNPAVTLGAVLLGRIKAADAVMYWICQFSGGLLGALLLWAVVGQSPRYTRAGIGLGANGWGVGSLIHINLGGAFLAEVILTAIFVFVWLTVTGRETNPAAMGLIGLALTLVHLVGIPLTGTSVNPARSLGPAAIVGGSALNQVWLFILAPLVGAVVAALMHGLLYGQPEHAVLPFFPHPRAHSEAEASAEQEQPR
ncbi:MAG TPA: aquaporin [Trebonia sp.]|nr:aquaporin [Trebonia sp.]